MSSSGLGSLRAERVVCVYVSVQSSRTFVSDSLRPHGLEHARLPCPSPTPGACIYLRRVFFFFFFGILGFFFGLFLAVLRGLRDLSYRTSDGTCVPCSGRVEP